MKKILKNTIVILIILYLGVLTILFFIQKKMVYFPDNTPFSTCDTFSNNEHKNYNGTNFYEKKGENNNVIIFFHGNAGRACDRIFLKDLLLETNASIIFIEYSGYANVSQSPSIKNILQDVQNIGNYIKQSPYDRVYIFGRSIGTGPASYYAENFQTDKLLLISPYSYLYKIAESQYPIFPIKYMFSENYEPAEYIKNYTDSLLVIHGEKDRVIPLQFGVELYDKVLGEKKELMILPDGNHNNIMIIPEITEKILQYLSS